MRISARDLDGLLSVAVADLDPSGVLRAANAGFLRLLGEAGGRRIGERIGRYFIQPDFATLAGAPPNASGEVYRGLMTIGEYVGDARTLRGRVLRTAKGLSLLAEHDIDEIERIDARIQDLVREATLSQRALGVQNVGLKRREAQIVEASLTDMLTGVGNRRRLDQALTVEIARAERSGQPLSALMVDLDHFKVVNDRYGHAVGDAVLAHLGKMLRSNVRITDIVVRFGGEEFIVLMPHTSLEHCADFAERIRRILERERIAPLTEPVTSSFGVAEHRRGEAAEAFLHRLDTALYEAKEGGRNRVATAAP